MQIVNRSRLPAEVFTAIDKGAREHLVVVAKATYRFGDGGAPSLAGEQKPVLPSDTFVGEPGLSAPIYESDFVPRKTRCDLLLDAEVHTPDGREVTELPVGVQVGSFSKRFLVVGDRIWRRGALGITATKPRPFSSMRIHYGRAFGGSPPKKRRTKDAPVEQATYWPNPIGTGYAPSSTGDIAEGMPLPSTEDFSDRVTSPAGSYKPLAFGPIGRHWDPRRAHAGTYDAAWRESTFPFLPEDFDEAFFQCAPPDQQIDFPEGGEPVALHHLVPGRAVVAFELPKPDLEVRVLHSRLRGLVLTPVVDTVFIEPAAGLLTYVYRSSVALDRRGLFAVEIVAAGPVCEKWWASKVLGVQDCGCGGDPQRDPPPSPDAPPAGDGAAVEPSESP
ncbi:MAG: DUF2169 domain-containing protein [Polyangiaceae bacterium]